MESVDLPMEGFATEQAWERWLSMHCSDSPGLWLKIAKTASGIKSITYEQALDVALTYGWIDGQKQKLDDTYWLQRFTPRTSRSKWSKVNCGRVEKLIEQGRMKPSGLREVEAAKADGRWDAAYHAAKTMTVPPDLQAALDANVAAGRFFVELDSKNRYSILYRIGDAKKPETRAARIQKYVAMLAEGNKIYP